MDEATAADTLDLRDYLAVMRRRRFTILQVVVLVVLVAVGVTFLQTPQYEAEARVVVKPNAGNTDAVSEIVLGSRELETQKELAVSLPVAETVVEELGLDRDPERVVEDVTVTLVRDTQILELRATSTDPEQAAALAQGFADAYLQFRRDQALEDVLRAQQALESRAQDIRDRLDEISRELTGATDAERTSLELEQARLSSDAATIATQQASLSGSEVFASGGGQVIKPAEVPREPVSPKPIRTGVLALVLGLMLGVGLAFLRDHLDDAIRSDDQAERAAGRSVLGHVPKWRPATAGDTRLASLVEPSSVVAESYRTLRTNLRFMTVGRTLRSLLVTSALPGEGKTTSAANLAVAFARTGARVVLVGSDLRRPMVHKAFGIDGRPGLSDVLVGEAELVDVITDVGVPNLRVVCGGNVPPNPAELLGAHAMTELMEQFEHLADLVIYDGPPVLAVADALEMAPHVGGVALVVDVGETGRHALAQAAARIQGVGGNLSGLVLNNVDPDDAYGTYGYYGGYESHEPDSTEERTPSRRAERSASSSRSTT